MADSTDEEADTSADEAHDFKRKEVLVINGMEEMSNMFSKRFSLVDEYRKAVVDIRTHSDDPEYETRRGDLPGFEHAVATIDRLEEQIAALPEGDARRVALEYERDKKAPTRFLNLYVQPSSDPIEVRAKKKKAEKAALQQENKEEYARLDLDVSSSEEGSEEDDTPQSGTRPSKSATNKDAAIAGDGLVFGVLGYGMVDDEKLRDKTDIVSESSFGYADSDDDGDDAIYYSTESDKKIIIDVRVAMQLSKPRVRKDEDGNDRPSAPQTLDVSSFAETPDWFDENEWDFRTNKALISIGGSTSTTRPKKRLDPKTSVVAEYDAPQQQPTPLVWENNSRSLTLQRLVERLPYIVARFIAEHSVHHSPCAPHNFERFVVQYMRCTLCTTHTFRATVKTAADMWGIGCGMDIFDPDFPVYVVAMCRQIILDVRLRFADAAPSLDIPSSNGYFGLASFIYGDRAKIFRRSLHEVAYRVINIITTNTAAQFKSRDPKMLAQFMLLRGKIPEIIGQYVETHISHSCDDACDADERTTNTRRLFHTYARGHISATKAIKDEIISIVAAAAKDNAFGCPYRIVSRKDGALIAKVGAMDRANRRLVKTGWVPPTETSEECATREAMHEIQFRTDAATVVAQAMLRASADAFDVTMLFPVREQNAVASNVHDRVTRIATDYISHHKIKFGGAWDEDVTPDFTYDSGVGIPKGKNRVPKTNAVTVTIGRVLTGRVCKYVYKVLPHLISAYLKTGPTFIQLDNFMTFVDERLPSNYTQSEKTDGITRPKIARLFDIVRANLIHSFRHQLSLSTPQNEEEVAHFFGQVAMNTMKAYRESRELVREDTPEWRYKGYSGIVIRHLGAPSQLTEAEEDACDTYYTGKGTGKKKKEPEGVTTFVFTNVVPVAAPTARMDVDDDGGEIGSAESSDTDEEDTDDDSSDSSEEYRASSPSYNPASPMQADDDDDDYPFLDARTPTFPLAVLTPASHTDKRLLAYATLCGQLPATLLRCMNTHVYPTGQAAALSGNVIAALEESACIKDAAKDSHKWIERFVKLINDILQQCQDASIGTIMDIVVTTKFEEDSATVPPAELRATIDRMKNEIDRMMPPKIPHGAVALPANQVLARLSEEQPFASNDTDPRKVREDTAILVKEFPNALCAVYSGDIYQNDGLFDAFEVFENTHRGIEPSVLDTARRCMRTAPNSRKHTLEEHIGDAVVACVNRLRDLTNDGALSTQAEKALRKRLTDVCSPQGRAALSHDLPETHTFLTDTCRILPAYAAMAVPRLPVEQTMREIVTNTFKRLRVPHMYRTAVEKCALPMSFVAPTDATIAAHISQAFDILVTTLGCDVNEFGRSLKADIITTLKRTWETVEPQPSQEQLRTAMTTAIRVLPALLKQYLDASDDDRVFSDWVAPKLTQFGCVAIIHRILAITRNLDAKLRNYYGSPVAAAQTYASLLGLALLTGPFPVAEITQFVHTLKVAIRTEYETPMRTPETHERVSSVSGGLMSGAADAEREVNEGPRKRAKSELTTESSAMMVDDPIPAPAPAPVPALAPIKSEVKSEQMRAASAATATPRILFVGLVPLIQSLAVTYATAIGTNVPPLQQLLSGSVVTAVNAYIDAIRNVTTTPQRDVTRTFLLATITTFLCAPENNARSREQTVTVLVGLLRKLATADTSATDAVIPTVQHIVTTAFGAHVVIEILDD